MDKKTANDPSASSDSIFAGELARLRAACARDERLLAERATEIARLQAENDRWRAHAVSLETTLKQLPAPPATDAHATLAALRATCQTQKQLLDELLLTAQNLGPRLHSHSHLSWFARGRQQLFRRLHRFAAARTPYRLGESTQYEPRPVRYDRLRRPSVATDRLPRICLVTPSYQQAHFLEHTMRSVLDQDYPKLAYGVQDGGSTDGSVKIIERHISRLSHAESAPDRGQADAIRRGFEKLFPERTDLMGWLNSDDLLAPGTLHFVADYFARHPEVDVLYGHRIIIDEAGRETARWFLPPYHDNTLKWFDLVPQETLFWRASCYQDIGGMDPTFHFAMDWDLLLRFEEAGYRIARVPYFLGCFRTHPQQKTSAKIKTVGEEEMTRLRIRTHGRPLAPWQIMQHLIPEQQAADIIAWLSTLGIRW